MSPGHVIENHLMLFLCALTLPIVKTTILMMVTTRGEEGGGWWGDAGMWLVQEGGSFMGFEVKLLQFLLLTI